jgi:hypothetical protein
MELNSAFSIVWLEGFLVLVVLGLLALYTFKSTQKKEISQIDEFVSAVIEEASFRNHTLETILCKQYGMNGHQVGQMLQKLSVHETTLIQRIIQMYLQRDPALLTDIDQLISNINQYYCQLLTQTHPLESNSSQAEANASDTAQEVKTLNLEHVNELLIKQLDTAMHTIEDMSNEYTRVFSGNQTALELENSSKKMLQLFIETEQTLRKNMRE